MTMEVVAGYYFRPLTEFTEGNLPIEITTAANQTRRKSGVRRVYTSIQHRAS